jgi:hypothetical protein
MRPSTPFELEQFADHLNRGVVRGIFGSLLMTRHFCSCPTPRVARASACQCRQPDCRSRRRPEGHDGYQPCRGTMSRRQLDCRLHLREDRAAIEPVSLSSRRRSGSAIVPPQSSRRIRVHCSPFVVLIHVGRDVVRVGAGEQASELLKAVAEYATPMLLIHRHFFRPTSLTHRCATCRAGSS